MATPAERRRTTPGRSRGQRRGSDAAPADLEQALTDLGVSIARADDEEVTGWCPGHPRFIGREQRRPKWSVNRVTGYHNCLGGETRVLTVCGSRSIRSLAGAVHTVLTSQGWAEAPFKSYGEQQLYDVVLTRNGVRKVIRATADHRWFGMVSARGGGKRKKEMTTAELTPGRLLASTRPPRSGTLKPSPYGAAHGFVWGDGTATAHGCKVMLCGEKDAEVAYLFPWGNRRIVEGVGTEIYGLPLGWKVPAPLHESPSYLYGFLAGWFAADGCVDEQGMPTIASADRGHLEYLRDLCNSVGVVTYGVRMQNRVGIDGTRSNIFSVSFSRSSLSEEFFLLSEHRRRWSVRSVVRERIGWVVQEVTEGMVEEVYCAEVPETHDFVLEDHILTGNCFSCEYQGTFQGLVMDMLGLDSPFEAARWVRRYGLNLERALSLESWDERHSEETRRPAVEVSEDALAEFWHPIPDEELEARRLTREACEHFGILWDQERSSWVIPIRMPDGTLIGWQRKGGKGNRRYFRNIPISMEKSLTLFGYHQFPAGGSAKLVESPLAVPRFWQAGVTGALATMGDTTSAAQMVLVRELTDELVVCRDDDEAGRAEARRLRDGDTLSGRPAYRRRFVMSFFRYPDREVDGTGPDDCEDDEIRKGVREAVHAVAADLGGEPTSPSPEASGRTRRKPSRAWSTVGGSSSRSRRAAVRRR